MKKWLKITLLSIVVVLILLGFLAYNAIFATATRAGYLMIDGAVEVDTGKGWKPAIDMMDLGKDDKIRTNDGTATVVFYDSVIITLQSDTEISVMELTEDNVEIDQASGSTWHKFAKIVGIEEYKVNTNRAVATIRGTETGVYIGADNDTVLLAEGDLNVKAGDESRTLDPLQIITVKDDGSIEIRDISPEEREDVVRNLAKTLLMLKDIRQNEIESHGEMMEEAMVKYSPAASMPEYLDQIDSGELDDNILLEEFEERSPVKVPAVYKVKNVNDEVKKSQMLIRMISEGATGAEIKEAMENKVYLS